MEAKDSLETITVSQEWIMVELIVTGPRDSRRRRDEEVPSHLEWRLGDRFMLTILTSIRL